MRRNEICPEQICNSSDHLKVFQFLLRAQHSQGLSKLYIHDYILLLFCYSVIFLFRVPRQFFCFVLSPRPHDKWPVSLNWASLSLALKQS